MKAATEFSDQHKGQDHQHAFNQHPRSAAKEHYQNERQKTEQKTCLLYTSDAADE